MASFISDSIFTALKAQFEEAMRKVVRDIAEGEGLDADELMAKYLVNVIPATKEAKGKAKVKAKPAREAKVTVKPAEAEDEASGSETACKCCATTAKGKPCALKPLSGTNLCRVHAKKVEEASGSGVTGPIKEKKKPKATKKKEKKREEPVHTHELDDERHDDCELCQTHGNPLDEEPEEFETVVSPPRSLRERLRRVTVEEFEDDDE